MLVIRSDQREALRQNMEPAWIALLRPSLVSHARRRFAAEAALLSTSELEGVADYAIQRARAHHFTTQCEMAKWLNLMFTFGRDFDSDCPWAADLLAAGPGNDPRPLIDRLYLAAVDRIAEARGIRGHHGRR